MAKDGKGTGKRKGRRGILISKEGWRSTVLWELRWRRRARRERRKGWIRFDECCFLRVQPLEGRKWATLRACLRRERRRIDLLKWKLELGTSD